MLAEPVLHYCVDFKIVQLAEDAFFGYPEYACHETVGQVFIVFERTGKQIADERDNVFIVSAGIALLDRRVVFIDNNNRFDSMLFS